MADKYKASRESEGSGLVLRADRRQLPKEEASGEAETLFGKINPKEFGTRAEKSKAPQAGEKKKKTRKKAKEGAAKRLVNQSAGIGSVIAATDGLEGLIYRPKTKETKATYELILNFVQAYMGDQPRDVIRGATDEILVFLKDDNLKDFDRKIQVEGLLSCSLQSEEFSQLVNLGKKITDYSADENTTGMDQDELDQVGVAVVFDEEEEEEDDIYDVRDEDEEGLGEVDEDDGHADEQDEDVMFAETVPASKFEPEKDKYSVSVHQIDAFWLQRQVSTYYPDAITSQAITEKIFSILENAEDSRECEQELVVLLDFDKFELVKLLTKNRLAILYCSKLAKAASEEEKAEILAFMKSKSDLIEIYKLITHESGDEKLNQNMENMEIVADDMNVDSGPKVIDLDEISFSQGSHVMSNKKVRLPENSFKKTKKGYEEIHIPAPKAKPFDDDEKLVPIEEIPYFAQPAFKGSKTLNRVQSRVFYSAMETDENILCCAPTGAGKTNVAMMTILREIGKFHDPATGVIDSDAFKIVYIAPMKALVQEMVNNFGGRLKEYGIKVAELTGDRQLTKAQIAETQIIVTTPEKWDVITRKSTDRSYTKLVRLIIIDEIHLLHDERGPVLESIVSRTIRTMEQTQEPVRLVGLSATLPNYVDVARFMRVDPEKGLFFFDNSFRPCPLQQQYIGITEKKAIKRFQMMNEITYEKVMEQAGKNQVLIFVHSRRETSKTAKMLKDMCIEKGTIGSFLPNESASKEILQTEAGTTKNNDLKELLPYGFAIHHAGMTRPDRTQVEELFSEGHIKVLVSTATLAWGVNLPAHTVIIKGTQVYNPEKGRWVELSPQDVLQMLGRAGRPQFDTFGEGIIITSHQELQYYLSLLNQQLPIESQFISRLVDNLNAEIVLGGVKDRNEAIDWLGYTYLYVRMLREPSVYSITEEEFQNDEFLRRKRMDLIHTAATLLEKCGLIKYDKKTGQFQDTEIGKIASHYYVTHQSMLTYNQHLKPNMSDIDLFRVFSLSHEFKYIPVRDEEKLELLKLLDRVPIPVKESVDEATAKINVLLQAYVSQLKLEGFALVADMVYVTQSALRIIRCLFEICLRRGWARLARKTLDLCKMVDKRMWSSMSPLRQFRTLNQDLIRKLERKDFPWERYYDLSAQQLGELVRLPKMGKQLATLIKQFPRLNVQAHIQPITRSMLKIELSIASDFEFDESVHSLSELFHVVVEDNDGETILFHDLFVLKERYSKEEHIMSFTVPLFEPLAPNYFVSVISDRWLHSESKIAISFSKLILPEKYPPHTELLDLQPLSIAAMKSPKYETVYASEISYFNPIQTQVFHSVYSTDENIFIGSATGSGKTLCAELAMIRLWKNHPNSDNRIVYITPFQETLELLMTNFKRKFDDKNIVALCGETSLDLKALDEGDVIVSTPQDWDLVSRRWKQRKNVQKVKLFIADDLQLIGGDHGPTYEIIVSRMRYISKQLDKNIRFVGLSSPLANAKDVAEWMDCSHAHIYNFNPSVRSVPLEVHISSFSVPHFASMMIAMAKPAFQSILEHANTKPALLFVPNRKQVRLTSMELRTLCIASDHSFLRCKYEEIEPYVERLSEDKLLKSLLSHGIAYVHEAQSAKDRKLIYHLYQSGAIQVLIASKGVCWGMPISSHLVIIMGTQSYEGKEHRYIDYAVTDMQQMIGFAGRPQEDEVAKCVLMCPLMKKDFYKKFLYEALPIESHLDHFLHDYFNTEIVTKTIENKEDAVDRLTWTFLFRRLAKNPNYYNLTGVSHRHLSEHLSDLVETTINDLVNSKCISSEEDFYVSPLNLGMIASYYNIHYMTIEMFNMSLTQTTKLRGLLEIICASAEFEELPIRHHEEIVLKKIYDRLPVKMNDVNFQDPHTKTNILLQSHFSRTSLTPDLEADQKWVLLKVINLLNSCVDVLSSSGWLNPALATMELCQMTIQAMWDRDSPLKQLPFFSNDLIDKLKDENVESVFDLMDLEDDKRVELLSMSESQLMQVAKVVNRYPNVDVSYEIDDMDDIVQDEPITIRVKFEREEDAELGPVVAPFYPKGKEECWWVVIGDPQEKTLLSIKRTVAKISTTVSLDFTVPKSGKCDLKLILMCDAYLGCDQEYEISLNVKPKEEGDIEVEEEDNDDDNMQVS